MALSEIVGEFEVGHETVECTLPRVGVLGGGVLGEGGRLVVLIVQGGIVVGVANGSLNEHGGPAGHNQEVAPHPVIGPFVGGDFGVIHLVVKAESEKVELGTALSRKGNLSINIQIIIGKTVVDVWIEGFGRVFQI